MHTKDGEVSSFSYGVRIIYSINADGAGLNSDFNTGRESLDCMPGRPYATEMTYDQLNHLQFTKFILNH